uniref:Uncharacterized protein n=1 Tax=Anguilla anguilla TaxID=7936 RepID=A0A0E9Y035_ANGAN
MFQKNAVIVRFNFSAFDNANKLNINFCLQVTLVNALALCVA